MGNSLEACISALDSAEINTEVHFLERINMTFLAQNAILNAPNITRFKVSGRLPLLQLNFSDRKYSECCYASFGSVVGIGFKPELCLDL